MRWREGGWGRLERFAKMREDRPDRPRLRDESDQPDVATASWAPSRSAQAENVSGAGTYFQPWNCVPGRRRAEHWGGYTEWFVLAPSGSDVARTQHYFDGGFIFPVTNDLQFDIRAGVGLSEASDDFFGGVGAVVRL